MLAKGKKTSNPDEKSGESPRKGGVKNWYENNQRSIIAVALIAIVAFVLRFIFAFGTSVDSGTALSGGSSASEHLHAIVAILDGGSFIGADGTLNYPFGSTNPNPVLYDLILTPFALIGKAMGMTSVAAASTALAWGAVVFGVLATVMAYFVGKEFLGEKKHGYLAAAFIAFCPVVISNTVFSNGTEIAFVAFLFMVMSFFVLKGVKSIDTYSQPTDKFRDIFSFNKTAMKYAVVSGIVLSLIVLSWNGFRAIVNALCVILAIMVIVDRLRKKDSRVIAVYFSIILLISMIVATAYYVPSGLWDAVLSGVLITALLSVAVCLSFAAIQKVPWTITIPVYAIVLIAVFAALWFLAPDYFNVIVNGNSVYADKYGSLVNVVGLSLSTVATNYGFITVWFPFITVIMMLWKLPKNINSPAYLFTIIWLCFGIGYGIFSEELAVIFAPAYALGFAYILAWLFDNVKFKEYFDAIRASDIKSVWKKLIKPIPFLSILGVLLLICAPNALYAIDAGISSNDTDNHEGLDVGALSYYIKTDSDWKVNDIFSQYSSADKEGAMLTWTEYATDASTYGGFSVTTDSSGNGARFSSITLLANGKDNTAVADMAIDLIKYYGIDASKTALLGAGMSEDKYNKIKAVFDNPSNYRLTVINNPDKYGIFSSSISDETIMYVMCSNIMTSAYSAYKVADFYEAMSNVTGKAIGYVMVTQDMIPISYGRSSLFASMAKIADYEMYDDYGSVTEFVKTDSTSMYFTQYYTGVYSYTDSMSDTLVWRSYIGMSPAEAGFTGYYASTNYISALMLSDGSVKAIPGYGLSNFEVDVSSWYVDYNADSKATIDSDGWTKMLAKDAQTLQEKNGGLINYLAGYPVIMKYVSNSSGTAVSGTVYDEYNAPVKGVRVSVIDQNDTVRSTAVTDEYGKYTVVAVKGNTIEYISSSTNLVDGTIIESIDYTDPTVTTVDVTIQVTTIDFKLVDSDGKDLTTEFKGKAKFVGQNTGDTKWFDIVKSTQPVTGQHLVPDIYDITITDETGAYVYATATYTVVPGQNTMYNIKVEMYTVTVTIQDDMGIKVGSEYIDKVVMTETTYGTVFEGDNDKGTAKINVISGTYAYTLMKGASEEFTDAASTTVSAATSETVTYYKSATSVAASAIDNGQLTVIYAMGYQDATVHASTAKFPTGSAGNAAYTIYTVNGNKVLLAKTTDATASYVDASKVSGTLKNSSGTLVSGTIVFIVDGMQIPASSDSEGKFSVMLPQNKTYTIYAQYGSEVLIEKNFAITYSDVTKELTTAAGTKVSGDVSWYSSSSSRRMMNVPVTITYDDVTFSLVTDSSGEYSMYIPADKTCKITATVDGTNFYFDTAGTATSTKTDVTGASFVAKVKNVTVTNHSGYTIQFSGYDKTENGGSIELAITSTTWYVSVYQGDNAVLSSVSVPSSVRDIPAGYFDVPDYIKVSFDYAGEASTDKITITAIAGDGVVAKDEKGEYQTISSTSHEYFFERGDATLPYEYLITLKDTDSKKIGYAYLSLLKTDSDMTVTMKLESSFTVSGVVGVDGSGTVGVDGIAVDKTSSSVAYKVDTTDGSYSMTLPVMSSDYVFHANIAVTDGNDVYNYSADRTVAYTEFEAEKTYVRNLAVTLNDQDYKGDVRANLEILPNGMENSTIKFKVNIYGSKSEATYLLTGGTDWQSIKFYSDSGFGTQISSVVVDTAATETSPVVVYAIGKISIDSAGLGTDGLSVSIADINDSASCTAVFSKYDSNWVKTTANKSTIQYGTDSVSKSEYRYAVSIINSDNYTKKFTISDVKATEGTLTDTWFVTFVDDNNISSDGQHLEVLGHQTATLYVKITVKDASSEKVPAITFKVTSENTNETFVIGEDVEGGITKDNDSTVSVKSTEQSTLVNVTDMSADGRGVYNEYGETPVYVYVLYGIAILLVLIVVWLALKRGAFSRKK